MSRRAYIDSFSGRASDLPRAKRTPDELLRVLAEHPRVSTWDMSEQQWLRTLIHTLEGRGLIAHAKDEQYPWLRYELTDAGHAALKGAAAP